MEVPGLIEQRLEDETPRDVVNLGGEDRAVFTPDRTLVYRAESLLSDADVEVYSNDVERLSVSSGRRKSTFILESVEGTERLRVPNEVASAVLERLLGGILDAAGVIDDDEEVKGVYRFSDLTLVVTDARVVKHIGPAIWEEESEEVPFSAITGLEFEEGRVAMQIVLAVEGRVERIKAPNEEAPLLRRTLTDAVLDYHDLDSVEELNETLGPAEEVSTRDSSYPLDESISPLIGSAQSTEGSEADETTPREQGEDSDPRSGTGSEEVSDTSDESWQKLDESVQSPTEPADGESEEGAQEADDQPAEAEVESTTEESVDSDPPAGEWSSAEAASVPGASSTSMESSDPEALEREIDQLSSAVDGLTETVEQQNELLEQQSELLADLEERLSETSTTEE